MSQYNIIDENKPIVSTTNHSTIRTVLLLLFIFSFFTLFMGIWLVTVTSGGNQLAIENMWLFFLPLPIPLTSLVLGIIYKKKGFKATKNIIVGIIFTIILIIYGSFTFIFGSMYSHDLSYLQHIETQINFALPDEGNITTQDWTNGTQTGMYVDPVQYLYTSDITFTEKEEISKLNLSISKSDMWITSVNTTLSGLVPSFYSDLLYSSQYDYFMIYNANLNSYNTMPSNSGTYSYVFIAYSSLDGNMKIIEYTLDVIVNTSSENL